MMQNGIDESFWDAHGVEIGACAIFHDFGAVVKNWRWANNEKHFGSSGFKRVENAARIRRVLARASGTARASRLKRVNF